MNQQTIKTFLPIALALFLAGCATAPLDFPKTYSEAPTDTSDTYLAGEAARWVAGQPGESGYYPLLKGLDALGARLALIDRAERTIDAQYFLMKPDSAGRLFAGKLLEAADRGVRIRLLLDDIFTTVEDDGLILLNQHPNIELRLFNPIGRGGLYYLSYVGHFKLANRRMHNKSITVDNQISIVGGRNIADEYFELLGHTEFVDFDMLAVGPVTADISTTFDRFWNHELSVPMEAFETGKQLADLETVRANVNKDVREASRSIYGRALQSPLMREIREDKIDLYSGSSRVITDDPDKLLNRVSDDQKILVTELAKIVAEAKSDVVVITPYFIPGKRGVEFWRSITAKGVRVVILTNSLATNNHVPVHSAYARYRHDMIDAGVELYEVRVDASRPPEGETGPGYDSLTLHTKAVFIDRRMTFVGSLNLDPRSIDINTESGVFIDSGPLAAKLTSKLFEVLPTFAYRVTENEKGKLKWTVRIDGMDVVEDKEPQAGGWLRFKAWLFRAAPESQL
ncbi:MAG: phospholipase D family protein [Xanthomonadales bacterium]|nr:phospholipase D family protein [Gammaproteobacteria bacterium]NNK05324.1 phospholipase D family protein [Xanthomonadales bacterium]